jgi:hypothetical protein
MARYFEFLGLTMAGDQQRASALSSDALYDLSSAIVEDLISLQRELDTIEARISLQFLQFEVSAFVLHVAISHGEAGRAYDWIYNAVAERLSQDTVREFNPNRFAALLGTTIDWIAECRAVPFLQWISNFYYYCRNWSALYDVAEQVLPYAFRTLTGPSPHAELTVQGVVFALNWATAYNHPSEPDLSRFALACFNNSTLPMSLRAQIAIAFLTTAARFTDKSSQEWAHWALDNASATLNPSDKLQALLSTITTVADWNAQRQAVLQAIDACIAHLRASFPQPTAFVQRLEQSIKMLDIAVFRLHAFERSDALLEVLCHWYGVSEATRRHGPVLFFIPNHSSGMAYLGQGSHLFPFNTPDAIDTLNRTTNRGLGVALTLSGQVHLEPVMDRPGVPANDMAALFRQVTSTHYRWSELDSREYDTARAAIFLPGYPHPLQYLMKTETGRCLPIAASLQEPREDRRIRRGVIWFSDEDYYSAMEADAVGELMEAAGIRCDRMSGQEHTKEDFLAMYANSEYDVLWVAGHGEYDRWNPRSPSILVGGDSEIGIDELLALPIAPDTGGRRLFVLNICDSGAAAVFGGMHKLGLAPMLASREQAVVGHLWPVDPLVAAAFGVKLAREILQMQGNFFAAFQEALAAMCAPWPAFIENLADDLQAPIFERMRNNERDLSNIFHAGSAAFFE